MRFNYKSIALAMDAPIPSFLNLNDGMVCNCYIADIGDKNDQEKAFIDKYPKRNIAEIENEFVENSRKQKHLIQIPSIEIDFLCKKYAQYRYDLFPPMKKIKLFTSEEFIRTFFDIIEVNLLDIDWYEFRIKLLIKIAKNWVMSSFSVDYLYESIDVD